MRSRSEYPAQTRLAAWVPSRLISSNPEPGDSALSEAICSPCGPRYAYLAIDDGNNNHGSNLIANFCRVPVLVRISFSE